MQKTKVITAHSIKAVKQAMEWGGIEFMIKIAMLSFLIMLPVRPYEIIISIPVYTLNAIY